MSKADWVEGKGRCGSCGEGGAGSLKKCGGCHTVAYCSAACQKRDWALHRGRCSPISITELEDRGRGLVATKDLNMGDLIVKDRAVICVGNVGGVLLLHARMMITMNHIQVQTSILGRPGQKSRSRWTNCPPRTD